MEIPKLPESGNTEQKRKKVKKFPDFAHASHAQRRLEVPVGDITVFLSFFINMISGILIDRDLRYHPSGTPNHRRPVLLCATQRPRSTNNETTTTTRHRELRDPHPTHLTVDLGDWGLR